MSRVIAVMACGFTLAACSSSLPSLDFFKSAPTTETLRVESEPPGADARTAEGLTCRTPCELTVPAGTDTSVTVALNGYQPQTVPLHAELAASATGGDSSGSPRLQPNPIYVELQPTTPPRPTKKRAAPAKKKSTDTAARSTDTQEPAPSGSPFPNPADYPWPQPR